MAGERKLVSAMFHAEVRHREVLSELRRQAQLLETISETTKSFYGLSLGLVFASAGASGPSVAAYLGWF